MLLTDIVADRAAVAAAVPAVDAAAVAAVADAGQGLIHPYKLYFPCSGGRDSEASCLLSESSTFVALGNARKKFIARIRCCLQWNSGNSS